MAIRPRSALRLLAAALSLVLGAGLQGAGLAAPPGIPSKAYFHLYTDQDGLPQRTIYAMAVDRGGRIWAGTLAGIARFDGAGWETLATPASNYTTFVNSNAIAARADGSVWVGTRFQGILEFRAGRYFRSHDSGNGLPANNVNAILEGSERDGAGAPVLWAATYGKGVARFKDGKWSAFGREQGLAEERAFCLLETSPGQLWVGTTRGVWIGEAGRWRAFQGNAQLPDPKIRALAQTREADGSPCLWIGTEKEGLFRWSHGQLSAVPLKAWCGSSAVRDLAAGADGGLWIATAGGGAVHLRDGTPELFNLKNGLHSNSIQSVVETPGGAVWFGANGNGIARYRPGGWRRAHPPWPQGDNRIQAFWETRSASGESSLWAGSATQDLACFRHGAWSVVHAGPAASADTIRAIYSFPGDPDLFFGTSTYLGRLRSGQFSFFTAKEGFPEGQVRVITGRVEPGGRRTLWIGTSRGLVSWDGRAFSSIPMPAGDAEGSVRALAVDGERLWVGSDRGLACLQDGRWLELPVLEKFRNIPVDAFITQDGTRHGLWVGTLGSGLRHVENVDDPGSIRAFTTRTVPALPHDLVHDLLRDQQGRIYVSTPRGVARLTPGEGGWSAEDFTQEDGLPSLEGLKGGLFQDSGGRIWVATQDDPAWLDPAASSLDRTAKPLTWESAYLRGRILTPGEVLSHRDQDLNFQFRLLSYHREQDSRYRTQLVGLQAEPGPWNADASARFPSLPPGRYTLLAWARDFSGNVSGPIAFPFQIQPPPWNTGWAWLAYALLLAGAIHGLLVLRTRFLAERNRLLEDRIREATEEILRNQEDQAALNAELLKLNLEKNQFMGIAAHDLQNPLSSILLVTEGLASGELGECQPEILPWIRKVANAAHQMTSLIHEFLDVNAIESGNNQPVPRTVSVFEIMEPVLSLQRPRAAAKGQTLAQEAPEQELTVHADPNHLRQVLDNLVSNACKFSPRGARLVLKVARAGERVRFEVSDQGPGFTAEDRRKLFSRFAKLSARPTGGESSSGLGLSIVKHLVDANGGRIWVDSEPGKGATFVVELPEKS